MHFFNIKCPMQFKLAPSCLATGWALGLAVLKPEKGINEKGL